MSEKNIMCEKYMNYPIFHSTVDNFRMLLESGHIDIYDLQLSIKMAINEYYKNLPLQEYSLQKDK